MRRRRLGREIRRLRVRLGLSRNAFAERFHVSFGALVQIEEARPSNRRTREKWPAILAATAVRPRPRPVRRPPGVAVRLDAGRKCLTVACTSTVTGRAKKCPSCLDRARGIAAAQLALHAGRGRRTDLQVSTRELRYADVP
jgi:DNA-binding XRE family transcriptional regulator